MTSTTEVSAEDGENRALDYLRRTTAQLQATRRRLAQVEDAARAPIAVVGVGCRYPGLIEDAEDLWSTVIERRDVVSPFPTDRGWDLDALDVPVRHGGFLDALPDFDPDFFGIAPREATAMAPQQRLALEVCWAALEHASVAPGSLHGRPVGVFLGTNQLDYGLAMPEIDAEFAAHMITGATASAVSGRVAYLLGLTGPNMTVDTACSSSLVAVHLAVRALRGGECSLALAGGVAAMAEPVEFVGFGAADGLAADGRCKAFSEVADGMGLAEGAGAMLLARLDDARRDGLPVLAVIRGSAVNSDGASNGLTAPNGPAQQRVVRAALDDAGLVPDDIDLVEAHGTGTTLGDPIEANALGAVFAGRPSPLPIGSVKSNLGHTQAAAGVAGLLKLVMAMRAGVLPPTLHGEQPSSRVAWEAVRLLDDAEPWPESGRPRRAGVSSFGVSGTNAHVVVEEALPATAEDRADGPHEAASAVPPDVTTVPIVLSAHSLDALGEQARRLRDRLRDDPGLALPAVAASLVHGRDARPYRAVLLADDRDEAVDGLARLADAAATATGLDDGRMVATDRSVLGRAVDDHAVFAYPGQGGQWAGMAADLLDSPVFGAEFAACARALADHVAFSPYAALRGDEGQGLGDGSPGSGRTDVVQPLQWAVCTGLTALWAAFGVRPSAVVGHSQGEVAAAAAAGAIDRAEAARIVAVRARVIAEHVERGVVGGGMLALGEGPEATSERLARHGDDRLVLAAVNSPRDTVVSGPLDALEAVVAGCATDGVRTGRVDIAYASHSPAVAPLAAALHDVLPGGPAAEPIVPMLSTVTTEPVTAADLRGDYWYDNLRGAVRFADVVARHADDGHRTFLEVGPHPVLTTVLEATLDERIDDAAALSTLRRGVPGWRRFLLSAATAWARGLPVTWASALPPDPGRAVLPGSAHCRRRLWLERPVDGRGRARAADDDPTAPFWDAVRQGDAGAVADVVAPGDPVVRDAFAALEPSLPRLASWCDRRRVHAGAADWLSLVDWVPAPRVPAAPDGPARWTVLVPDEGAGPVGAVWLRAWREAGVLVTERAVTDVLDGADVVDGPADAVVVLGTDPPAGPDPAVAAVHGLLAVAAAHGAGPDPGPGEVPPLWCVTSGAVTSGPDDPPPAGWAAALWGAGRTAALELPGRWGGLLDVPAGPTADPAAVTHGRALLADPLPRGGAEDQIALRGAEVRVRRLVPAPPAARGDGGWRTGGTALVTGGAGGIGSLLCRWLADRGVAHLLVVSRRGAEPDDADALRAAGTAVSARAADVGDPEQLAAVVEAHRVAEPAHPIRSVFHLAGVLEHALLADVTARTVGRVWAAKAGGAERLDALLGDTLDAFVLFSSGAAVWGSAGQAAYGAANAALDALAERRAARGAPATSVAWGAWGGVGLAIDPEAADRLRRRGVLPMEPEVALAALDTALTGPNATVTVSRTDWPRFVETFGATRRAPLVAERAGPGDAAGPGAAAGPEADGTGEATTAALLGRLADLEPARARREVLALVTDAVGVALGRGPDQPSVGADTTFADLGMDSLIAVELRNALRGTTGLALPATVAFEHPSARALAAHVQELLDEATVRHSAVPTGRADGLEQVLDALGGVESVVVDLDDGDRTRLVERLELLLRRCRDVGGRDDDLADADADAMLALIRREFGR